MKFDLKPAQVVELLLADNYRDWSIQAAEGIVDWLETQERYDSIIGVEDRAPSLESIRADWSEYDDGWDWLWNHIGKSSYPPIVCKSMLAHIGIDPDSLDANLNDYELERIILDYISGKFEMFITRYSIVVRGAAF